MCRPTGATTCRSGRLFPDLENRLGSRGFNSIPLLPSRVFSIPSPQPQIDRLNDAIIVFGTAQPFGTPHQSPPPRHCKHSSSFVPTPKSPAASCGDQSCQNECDVPVRPRPFPDSRPGTPPRLPLPLHRVPEAVRLRLRNQRRVPL